MLPANNVYTSELDIFEQVDNNPTTVFATTHGSTNGVWGSDSQAVTVPNTGTGFHTYGVDWEPTTTTFYVDGVAVASAPTPTSMNNPMYLILNLAVGGQGSWPGSPDATTTFPANMQINWVHAYATANTNYVGGSASIPASGSAAAEAAAAAAEGGTTTASAVVASAASTSSASANIAAPTAAPAPVITIGSGTDTLALQIDEDYYVANAQFTVSVDGVQVGGTQTATAQKSSGSAQTFDVLGNFTSGSHSVAVDFLNDAYGGSASTDRNLYVESATINGTAVPGSSLSLLSSGTQTFNFTKAAVVAASPAVTAPVSSAVPVTIGSGSDAFTLGVSEDAWQGNAQYTVSVDGIQVGGTQTATALHSAGAIQTVTVNGNWGSGTHTVGVSFINDAYGGTASTDRNLYVNTVSYDGTAATPGSATLLSNGTASFSATAAPTGIVTLLLAEDAYKGNALYTATVDGTQVSSGAVTVLNSSGQSQAITLPGTLSAGTHQLAISFTNDLYGGSASTDRNLYVKGVELNGTVISGSAAALYSSGTDTLSIVVPQH